jgi:hypothetical protein
VDETGTLEALDPTASGVGRRFYHWERIAP